MADFVPSVTGSHTVPIPTFAGDAVMLSSCCAVHRIELKERSMFFYEKALS